MSACQIMNKKLLKKAFEAGRDFEYGYGAGNPYPSFTKWYNQLIKEERHALQDNSLS